MKEYKRCYGSCFWAGEPGDADNENITNVESYWDDAWVEHFGGVDAPKGGVLPFVANENQFYVALPYGEYNERGMFKANATQVPWWRDWRAMPEPRPPLLKNRWVHVRRAMPGGHEPAYTDAYGQWEDVGPYQEDDFAWVFGKAAHAKNREEPHGAGIDLSPAIVAALKLDTDGWVEWCHVEEDDVPDGPWKNVVTTSPIYWKGNPQ